MADMDRHERSYLLKSTTLSHKDPDCGAHSISVEGDTGSQLRLPSDPLNDDEPAEENSVVLREFYLAHATEVNEMNMMNIYSPNTTLQYDKIELDWRQYCELLNEDPEKLMNSITRGDISSFFLWRLNKKEGRSGRKLRGIQTASSLNTYRKNFLSVYRRVTGKDMDSHLQRSTLLVTNQLAQTSELSRQPRDKPCMHVTDVLKIIQTTLTTTEKMFQMGRYRIQTCFFMQGGFITANRPRALLGLRYKDVKVTVLRDPNSGPHNILIELTYNFTKSYLGAKPSNTFAIPEIIFDPSLCMSPHVFLLGLMFADKVFSNSELTPEGLFRLDIRPECKELVIPIKEGAADLPVFRQYKKTSTKCVIIDEELPYNTIKTHMKDIGEIAGFKEVARPYCLRYGSGNAFDKDGDVSENMRNMILNHSTSKVFLNHYASRNIKLDAQAVVRGTKPQKEILEAIGSMSRSIDPNRIRSLTKDQILCVDQDPEIRKLLRERARLAKRSPRYKEFTKMIHNAKAQKKSVILKRTREEYDKKQAEEDIRLQLSEKKFEEKINIDLRQGSKHTKEHTRLIKSVMSLPGSNIEEETRRRIKAIRAIAGYCDFEEGGTPRLRREGSCANHESQETVDMGERAIEEAKKVLQKEKRPKICFICLGNEALALEKRVYCFASPGDLSKHFKRHLMQFNERTGEECRLCEVHFNTLAHMQRHAFERHGTVSNSFS